MESLIILLVVVIIIITNIVRLQKKLKDPAPAKQQKQEGGWKKNLRDLLAEMQGDTQTSSGKRRKPPPGQGRSTGWEDLLSTEDLPEKEPETAPSPAETPSPPREKAEPAGRGRTLIESRSREGLTPEARIGETERREPAPPIAGPDLTAHRYPRRLQISRQELRRAVIWYEVLGPPMSLRDPEREMWL